MKLKITFQMIRFKIFAGTLVFILGLAACSGKFSFSQLTSNPPVWVVTTIAGTAGVAGSADGSGTNASFSNPQGIAVDSSGNLYVADYGNNTVRKISPDGAVSTLAGTAGISGSTDANGASASFSGPYGITVNTSGVVYVTDSNNNTIRKITPSGDVTTIAGTAGTSGTTNSPALFNYPAGIAVDSAGNLYVADEYNALIRKITPLGVVSTFAGGNGSELRPVGSWYVEYADGIGTLAGFSLPEQIAADQSGNLYVADFENDAIRKITSTASVTTFAGSIGVAGSKDGTGITANFYQPTGVAVDTNGNLFIVDQYNFTIREISTTGQVTTIAGQVGQNGYQDGIGTSALFGLASSIAVDSNGTLYVTDSGNQTIRKLQFKSQ